MHMFIYFYIFDDYSSEGRIDLARQLYSRLYAENRIQHWQNKELLVMDLHYFSRGMAYAAIYCAVQELTSMSSLQQDNISLQRQQEPQPHELQMLNTNTNNNTVLTIITGKNLGSTSTTTSTTSSLANDKLKESLIPTIVPSLSSNTIPTPDNVNDTNTNSDNIINNANNNNNIITKRSVNGTKVSESYRLITEIQNILIEDFYPPISSSTVVDNPGRLYIILQDIYSTC